MVDSHGQMSIRNEVPPGERRVGIGEDPRQSNRFYNLKGVLHQ